GTRHLKIWESLLQRAGNRDGTQVAGRKILQRTHQLADGCPRSSNYHRRRHQYLLGVHGRPARPPREAQSMPSRYRGVMTSDQVDARQLLATELVTAIDHIGIAVADLDAAIAWYHEHLGMILVHEEVNEDQGIREAMLAVRGAPKGTAQIQLMAPIDDSSLIPKFLANPVPAIHPLTLPVP